MVRFSCTSHPSHVSFHYSLTKHGCEWLFNDYFNPFCASILFSQKKKKCNGLWSRFVSLYSKYERQRLQYVVILSQKHDVT